MAPRPTSTLTILTKHPKPFKSSNLAIPPSPFSPKSPITPPPAPPATLQTISRPQLTSSSATHPPPPSSPLNWLWQCHLCHRCYNLGITQRCLDDGHYFCSGTTMSKRGKRHRGETKVLRHKACQSEFDYQGWKTWGSWRRGVMETRQKEGLLEGTGLFFMPQILVGEEKDHSKDCWNGCDYPSECRWSKQFAVRAATPERERMVVTVPSSPEAKSLEEIVRDVEEESSKEGLHAAVSSGSEDDQKPTMVQLLKSVKRRKRRSSELLRSPLAANPPTSNNVVAEERDERTV